MLRTIGRSRFLPIIPFAAALMLLIVLFMLTVILLELSGAFGTQEQTGLQKALQSIGDFTFIATFVTFTFVLPLAAISSTILLIRALMSRR